MPCINWGILGAGSISRKFCYGLKLLKQARIHAVASRTLDRARDFAQEFGAAKSYASVEALAQDPQVDVVFVGTPNALHFEHCMQLASSGKPMLCEKPFATNAAQARAVIERVRGQGLFCMEAMWMRFVPAVREAQRLISSGRIGSVQLILAQLGWPIDPSPESPLFDAQRGGGALLDLGVYPISLVLSILGRPEGVEAQIEWGASGVDEQATLQLHYANRCQALVLTSFRGLLANDAWIVGTHGSLRIHGPLYCPQALTIVRSPLARRAVPGSARGRLAMLARRSWVRRLRAWMSSRSEEVSRLPTLGEGYAHEALEVMRCLSSGAQESPIMPLDESLAVLEIVDEARSVGAS